MDINLHYLTRKENHHWEVANEAVRHFVVHMPEGGTFAWKK